jgi:23S rRNA pseudouridine2605 synthase
MRLAKILARAGIASRRASEKIIVEGRVTVDGAVALLPQTDVDPEVNAIQVDGEPIATENKVYFLLNKPKGYVCTARQGKDPLVIDLFEGPERLFTVGRLDKETTGLLLVTNDGYFANRVIHPSSGIEKEYLVRSDAEPTRSQLEKMRQGARVEGVWVKPISVKMVRRDSFIVTVTEGRNREVRRIVSRVGLDTMELTRIRIGNLRLGKLPVGHFAKMTYDECTRLFD